MKFHCLTIHNIASIADATIDFDAMPLAGADVFLISGETGAGKSTILDCICLALFNEVPRMKTYSGKENFNDIDYRDARQLLRTGTGEGAVTLTFTGNDGHDYEAQWQVRRARGKQDSKIQKAQWVLVPDGDTKRALSKQADIKPRIEQALGVDYSQFVRTSMLAQGEFTKFLSAKDSEKSAILEKLTGTQHFSRIGAEIYRITQGHKDNYNRRAMMVDATALLSDDDRQARTDIITNIGTQLATETEAATAVTAKLQWLNTKADIERRLAAVVAELGTEEYSARKENCAKLEAITATYAALAPARESLKKEQRAVAEHSDATAAITALQAEFERLPGGGDANVFADYEDIIAQLSTYESAAKSLATAQAEFSKISAEFNAIQEKAGISVNDGDDFSDVLTARIAANADELAAIERRSADWAAAARATMQPGCTCPVCLQTVHTLPPVEGELRRQWQAAKAQMEADVKACRELITKGSKMAQLGKTIETAKSSTDLAAKYLEASQAIAAFGMDWRADVAVFRLAYVKSKSAYDSLQQRIAAATDRRNRAQQQAEQAKAELNVFLTDNVQYTLAVIEEYAAIPEATITEYTGKIRKFREYAARLDSAAEQYRTQLTELAAKAPALADDDTIESLTACKAAADANIAELNKQKGAIEQELKADALARQRQQVLIAERDKAYDVWQRWEQLNSLLGSKDGDTFCRIAQSFVLESLLDTANKYLAKLTDRYRLRGVSGTYLILVEDSYNGYQCRPVVTSSGGESFMVSLALALALADVGASFSSETLFIDEGFGTLSGAPLQKAVSLLRSLHRSSGRRVGIISHVAELKTEIPVQIRVERSPARGYSTVSVVPQT